MLVCALGPKCWLPSVDGNVRFGACVVCWCRSRVLLPDVDDGWVLVPLQGAAMSTWHVPPPLRQLPLHYLSHLNTRKSIYFSLIMTNSAMTIATTRQCYTNTTRTSGILIFPQVPKAGAPKVRASLGRQDSP